MHTVKPILPLLLSLLLLVAVPAVRIWAVQCPMDLNASSTDSGSAEDQCHMQGASDLQPSTPSAAVPSLPPVGPTLSSTVVYAPKNHERTATYFPGILFHGNVPVFLRTGTLLI